jgi:hypothetical protein
LGLKYKGSWYAITHTNNYKGVKIPKYLLKMGWLSEKDEFLKRITNSAPNKLASTSLKIHKKVLDDYDDYKLDNLKNKRKRYNETKKSK